jgi:hypothetical protein
MPCFFVRNLPLGTDLKPQLVEELYTKLTAAIGCAASDIEIHLENTQYMLLHPNGSQTEALDVHIFVEWTARDFATKEAVAHALHEFFLWHGFHTDITFRDAGPETFFVKGKLIGPRAAE